MNEDVQKSSLFAYANDQTSTFANLLNFNSSKHPFFDYNSAICAYFPKIALQRFSN
jgi:hypothetical protein